ncbi:ice-binding family protein [Candidatus Microthrix parvicella]|uniref:ice-binding family protein n=1 Tax=Candidatus Neomicrothrix parvicella TaxID=41950 RepID=UPI0004B7DD9D|nr:ice-binding family protein [Candidatus Microthrix parvicella]
MNLRSRQLPTVLIGLLATVCVAAFLVVVRPAGAAEAPVGLGTAESYAVLAGSAVTNTGSSVINGDVGVSPGFSITGFPPGTVNGVQHAAGAEALQAQIDLVTAYNDAAGRTPATSVAAELGGTILLPGVYTGATLEITGTVTLDAEGDPDAVFVIQSDSTMITATNSAVAFIGGANPCNVFWQVGSSATLGTGTSLQGTILALTSITANTGATVVGSLLARNGAVTLDNNVITRPDCADVTLPTTTTSATTTTGATTTTTGATTTTEVDDTTTSTTSTTPTGGTPTGGTPTGGTPTGGTPTGGTPTGGTPTGAFSGGVTSGTSSSSPGSPYGSLGTGQSASTPLAQTGTSALPATVAGTISLLMGAAIIALSRRRASKTH